MEMIKVIADGLKREHHTCKFSDLGKVKCVRNVLRRNMLETDFWKSLDLCSQKVIDNLQEFLRLLKMRHVARFPKSHPFDLLN